MKSSGLLVSPVALWRMTIQWLKLAQMRFLRVFIIATMSPENQGVFQLLKEVTFLKELWDFTTQLNGAIFSMFLTQFYQERCQFKIKRFSLTERRII